jgi:hypothetical protein
MGIVEDARPLTSGGHLIRVDIGALGAALGPFLSGLYTKGATIHRPVEAGSSLSLAMEYLAQGVDDEFPTRLLLLSTRDARTAVFNNAWRSRGWFEMAFALTKTLQTDDVYFLSQANTVRKAGATLRGQYGGVQLVRVDKGTMARSISLVNDGGRWVFTTQGEPAPYEKPAQYRAPKKADRFPQALLEEYLRAMKLAPFRDEFYLVDRSHPAMGVEIEISGSERASKFPPITLSAIKERYGPFE